MFNDGYTEECAGIRFRRLLTSDREYVADLIRNKRCGEAEKYLFKPPYVFHEGDLTEEQKQYLFAELMSNDQEQGDLRNLIDGVTFYCRNQRLAVRSCDTCRQFWFDEETGLVAKHAGKYLIRPKHAPVACDTDRGCPKGHYSNPQVISEKNNKAFNHYLEFEGVGCPHPECPIMRRNWRWVNLIFKRYGHPAVHAGLRRPEDQTIPLTGGH